MSAQNGEMCRERKVERKENLLYEWDSNPPPLVACTLNPQHTLRIAAEPIFLMLKAKPMLCVLLLTSVHAPLCVVHHVRT